ncbi:hypothetical protein [Luteimonas lutimaris]
MNDDFSRLYAHLGLREDCSLDEFKQACRRRIQDQHPDRLHARTGHRRPAGEPQIPLVELLPLYAKALRFHRRHGRLPGAPLHGATSLHAQDFPPAAQEAAMSVRRRPSRARETRPGSLRGPLLASLGVVATLALIGGWSDRQDAPPRTPDDAMPLSDPGLAQLGEAPARLEIGMDEQTVRAIQGEPLQWNGSEWVYGPSWLRFEDGSLVDWYSSPLHPLHTSTRTPPR